MAIPPPLSPPSGSLSDASTCSTPSSDLDSSGDDSDFNPLRVNFGPQKTPERRFLRKVKRKDSREFHRRQTIHWGESGEAKDRVERREGDEGEQEGGEQQGGVGDRDDERIAGEEGEEGEGRSTAQETPSRSLPQPLRLSNPSRTPPPLLAWRSNDPPPSSPYDGDTDSEADSDRPELDASYIDSTPAVDGDWEDEEEEKNDQGKEEDIEEVAEVALEPSPPSQRLEELEEEVRTPASPSLLDTVNVEPSTPSLPSSSPPPLPSASLGLDLELLEQAPVVKDRSKEPREEVELVSPLLEEQVEEPVLGVEAEVETDIVEKSPVVGLEAAEPSEEVASLEQDGTDIELATPSQQDSPERSATQESALLDSTFAEQLGETVVEKISRHQLVQEAAQTTELVEEELQAELAEGALALEASIAIAPPESTKGALVVEDAAVGPVQGTEGLAVDASPIASSPSERLIDLSPEKQALSEASQAAALSSPTTTTLTTLSTPQRVELCLLDSPPTPFNSLPVLLPISASNPALSSSSSVPDQGLLFQSVEAVHKDSIKPHSEKVEVFEVGDETETSMLFDASVVYSVAEVTTSPSTSETTDEDVELGRCGDGGTKKTSLAAQIINSPTELSPPPSSDSDSASSLATLGTPTPSTATPRPRVSRIAVPTSLRPTESQSSTSSASSSSTTPPAPARRLVPTRSTEKRPAPKVLKRVMSPQKAAAAAEKEADRLARLQVRAQLDAAVSRSVASSPLRSVSKPAPSRALGVSTQTLGPSPRVAFVRTLARVTPSPPSSTATSRLPAPQGGLRASAASSSSTARNITPQLLHRSKAAAPPPASSSRPVAPSSAATARPQSLAQPSAAFPLSSASAVHPPSSSSRPIFGSRTAPPQPSSALKARGAAPSALPSISKAPTTSHLPKPSSSGIPKLTSFLAKGPSARVPPAIGTGASTRAPLGGALSGPSRPKQGIKVFSSCTGAGPARRAGGDMSMAMPVSVGVGGGAFARGGESESSFRMDSSFRMESPRLSRPKLGEPVRVLSPSKAGSRHFSASMAAGPVRVASPMKASSSGFASSLGPPSSYFRTRDGPFTSTTSALFAQPSSGSFSETRAPLLSPPRRGQTFFASMDASTAPKAPISLRDGKSLPSTSEPSSSSRDPTSMLNETRSPSSNGRSAPALAASSSDVSSPPSTIPSSPSKSSASSSTAPFTNAPPPPPPPPPAPPATRANPTDPSLPAPSRSLRARRPDPEPPVASSSRSSSAATPRPASSSAKSKKSIINGTSSPPPPEEMSVAQLKSFTLMNTTRNQVYFNAMEKVVVRKDGENRPSSPGEKVKKAGSDWADSAGKKRKKPLFDEASPSDDDDDDDNDEAAEKRATHVRGPGEDEDFFSPVKQPIGAGGKGRSGKRSRGGAGDANEPSEGGSSKKKGVKWDKGLVWIRARKNEPLELHEDGEAAERHEVGSTRGRKPKKGCLKRADRPLDHMGNLPTVLLPPLTEILKRDKVTYTQLVYDDDEAAKAAPAKKGKK